MYEIKMFISVVGGEYTLSIYKIFISLIQYQCVGSRYICMTDAIHASYISCDVHSSTGDRHRDFKGPDNHFCKISLNIKATKYGKC